MNPFRDLIFRIPCSKRVNKLRGEVKDLRSELEGCRTELVHERRRGRAAKAQMIRKARDVVRTMEDRGVVLSVQELDDIMKRPPD